MFVCVYEQRVISWCINWLGHVPALHIYVTVYGKTGHNAVCVNIEKRSIDFLKMYCFKPTEGNG